MITILSMLSASRPDNSPLVCYLGVGVWRFDANMLSASYARSPVLSPHPTLRQVLLPSAQSA
jgi:hypothetical protein